MAALFPDALDDDLKPLGWSEKPLLSLATKISKGTTPTKQEISSATDEPIIRFIKVKDLNDDGEINRESIERIPASVHSGALRRSILESRDILFSIAGTIGRVAVVDADLANSNTNQALAFVRLRIWPKITFPKLGKCCKGCYEIMAV